MISGYPNELYDKALSGWQRKDIQIDNKASSSKKKRIMTLSLS